MFNFSSLMHILDRARLYSAAAAICLTATLAQAGETTNKIGITMVDVPAGTFQMGSGGAIGAPKKENNKGLPLLEPASSSDACGYSDDDAEDSEKPQHPVNVKAFQIGKTEVTLGQFRQFIDATGYDAEMGKKSEWVMKFFNRMNAHGDDVPVVAINWHDAQAFIDWLNKTDGGGYRLPSEAEWEYACRAGSYQLFCGTDDFDDLSWARDDTQARSGTPVRGKPNAFGLYDMSGNAAEWVQDCWHGNYSDAPADGGVWAGGNCEIGVVRGGAWFNSCYKKFRAGFRGDQARDVRSREFGFRVVRDR